MTYIFHCKNCNTNFEQILSVKEMNKPICPKCNANNDKKSMIERLLSSPQAIVCHWR